ncbi:hypothetical protein [Actinomadura hibisca]|uniref:hypothetical protein n=1 Tax=Actinomadura hibisca TaxID=68565 RepID=UPI00083085D7|nr:hypothetical protein [Actinomadura hibisca]
MAVTTRRNRTPAEQPTGTSATAAAHVWAVARIALAWIFLWAFLDKTFGLGHETPAAKAWTDGGSPTMGFLKNSPEGPFAGLYHDLAGQTWADWLFMIGLAGIGAALLLGVAMRAAAVAGGLLLVLMWTAVLPPANNPFLDDHLVYTIVLVGLALVGAGDTLGLGRWWGNTALVRKLPILK